MCILKTKDSGLVDTPDMCPWDKKKKKVEWMCIEEKTYFQEVKR